MRKEYEPCFELDWQAEPDFLRTSSQSNSPQEDMSPTRTHYSNSEPTNQALFLFH